MVKQNNGTTPFEKNWLSKLKKKREVKHSNKQYLFKDTEHGVVVFNDHTQTIFCNGKPKANGLKWLIKNIILKKD